MNTVFDKFLQLWISNELMIDVRFIYDNQYDKYPSEIIANLITFENQ